MCVLKTYIRLGEQVATQNAFDAHMRYITQFAH